MNTNYDLRKALYNFLDVKFDSATAISIANGSKFKTIKVEAGSIVNIFISAQNGGDANSIYLNAFGIANTNEYYSDFLIKVYWDANNNIYILNENGGTIEVNSIYVEFLKGKLVESYLVSSTDDLSALTPKITVDSSNVNRINYKTESLTFKSEYDTLVSNFNSFKSNYDTWKATLGLYAQVDKLVPDSTISSYFTTYPKHKKISEYISNASIHSDLLIDGSVIRAKLESGVQTSLGLADVAVQSVKLNGGAELKDITQKVNVNALTKLKLENYNAGPGVYKEYNVNSSGEIIIDDWSTYMQPKLLGATGDLIYFDGNDTITNIAKSLFLLDSDILVNASGWGTVNDVTVPSSLLVSNALALKVDKINRIATPATPALLNVSVNAQGQVTSNTNVTQNNLTTVIGDYYLTVSYEWNSVAGELKLL